MNKILSGEEVAAEREAAQKTTDDAVEAAGSNQLSIVVANSGLEPTKAQVILTKFGDSAEILADWEQRSKAIVVTDASQTGVMQMARAGRLALKAMRVEVERTRKEMKVEIVTQGKAIDGVANFLKGAIEPIEKHLADQEYFVERQEEIASEARRQLAEEALQEKEAQAAADEAARIVEQEAENERLKKEQAAADAAHKAELEKERKANDAKLAEAADKAKAEVAVIAKRQAKEMATQAKAAKQAADEQMAKVKARAAVKAKADREAAETARKLAEKEAADREAALQEELRQARMVTCPHCGETFENKPKEQS